MYIFPCCMVCILWPLRLYMAGFWLLVTGCRVLVMEVGSYVTPSNVMSSSMKEFCIAASPHAICVLPLLNALLESTVCATTVQFSPSVEYSNVRVTVPLPVAVALYHVGEPVAGMMEAPWFVIMFRFVLAVDLYMRNSVFDDEGWLYTMK